MKNKNHDVEFEILSDRDHVRKKTGMYLGNKSIDKVDRFIMGEWKTIEYIPALNKMIDEIIDNSVDEAIRTNFKYANEISVTVKGETITVTDNGRGIPHKEVVEPKTGQKLPQPVAAWTLPKAGTNFNETRIGIGTNGVGSAATNYMSKKFTGLTWQGGKSLKVISKNGCESYTVEKGKKTGSGTQVTFTPDMSLLASKSLHDVATLELIQDRLTSLQIAFPEIRFKFNARRIKETTPKKYAEMFVPDGASVVLANSTNLSYFITSSDDGFRTNGYINGVNTRLGGTYTDFIINGIVGELGDMIKRKYKIEVAKSTIKNGLTFILFARNFTNAEFDSQTKERLVNNVSDIKTHYATIPLGDFKSFAKRIMNSADIIEPIVEAQLAKKMAADKRAATLAQKKAKEVKVAKHIAATNKNATIFLLEGDSATNYFLNVRDPDKHGAFPLRGVVKNTWDMKPVDVLQNKELNELVAVLGLDINDPDSVDDMNYKHIATLTDADMDGNHICALLLAFFYRFWPRLFSEDRILITRTPILISTKARTTKWFYTFPEANAFKTDPKKSQGFYNRYIKGIGSLTEEEYSEIINNPKFDTVSIDNDKWFEVMFGKDTDVRKVWLRGNTPEVIGK